MYSKEELEEIDKRLREAVKKEYERINHFWKDEYPAKTEEEKIRFWAADMYKSMRNQEESGLKVYSMYTNDWLNSVLEKEPDFIKMLPQIYNIWGGMFDSTKVDNMIKKILNS